MKHQAKKDIVQFQEYIIKMLALPYQFIIYLLKVVSIIFKEMKEYLYEQIKEVDTENLIIVIITKKNDIYEEREAQDEEGEAFVKQIGGCFVSTSAKNESGVY